MAGHPFAGLARRSSFAKRGVTEGRPYKMLQKQLVDSNLAACLNRPSTVPSETT